MSEKDLEYLQRQEPFRRVEILGGEYKTVDTAALVGYCHNKEHKGFITVTILNEHKCIEKECHYFERFEEYPFWEKFYRKEQLKQIEKIKKQHVKENEEKRIANVTKREETIRRRIYAKAKKRGIKNLEIGSIRQDKFLITVFYITNQPMDDSEKFHNIAIEMEKLYHKQFKFVHIKTPDGRYATTF